MDQQKDASLVKRSAARTGRASAWLFRVSMSLILVLGFVCAGLFVGGFLQFTHTVTTNSFASDVADADGIVVLTGGSDRIAQGLDLLAKKKASRLLISGVNPVTTGSAIEKMNPFHYDQFRCCVDMERKALDTIGNAAEAAKWVEKNGFTSIILVTSDYHMPRSRIEFRRQMPQVTIIAHPVRKTRIDPENWWRDPKTIRLLMSEYSKLLGARSRDYVAPETLQALRATVWGS